MHTVGFSFHQGALMGCVGLGAALWCDAAIAQPVTSFSCPARVVARSAVLTDTKAVGSFAMHIPSTSAAHLSRVSIQQGSGPDASDFKPERLKQRWQWTLPPDRKQPTTVWCHYEGGVALARPLRSSLKQCTAVPDGADVPRAEGLGGVSWGLGRMAFTCS